MHSECPLEPVPKPENSSTYIYSVTESPSTSDNTVDQIPWNENLPVNEDRIQAPAKPTSKFLRWPYLLVYALCIALLAGTIGGFLGEIIAKNRSGNISRTIEDHCPLANASTPTPTSTSTPPSTVFARTISVPTTGCTRPTTQRSFKSTSQFFAAQYKTYCATGWLNDELFATSAGSASDCMEACIMYNGHKRVQDRSCVGGGFIPEWRNQSKAMTESGVMPYNCFLKSNDSGTGRNEKNVEVVSLGKG
ncbi:hypothetical protein CC86DRAFT_355446 [Ophiobolus disseminans]|uniref:Uncharacterized protein n=1 Tax=Ophiobolus disseminans TaxID=1469910 RepID=A0A6A6ZSH3_9PLEO|nr:hypothetical protein CC86DRAFT_355446 [Ophiobolus disseminans]